MASSLWRRTGEPYVNLGVPRGSSTQELISALPFADRTARFVVCSGSNNLRAAFGAPLDPLLGPAFHDVWLKRLRRVRIEELGHVVWAARKGRAPPLRPLPGKFTKYTRPQEADTIVGIAARLQLRDLRALRRTLPAEAEVVFALQPIALATAKELSKEEEVIFEALDVVQAGSGWQSFKDLVASHWHVYVAQLAEGCANLGVRFLDLSEASFTGWCFLDRIHMTDHGNDIAAEFLVEAIA